MLEFILLYLAKVIYKTVQRVMRRNVASPAYMLGAANI